MSLTYESQYHYGDKYDYDARGRVIRKTCYFGTTLDSTDNSPIPGYTKYGYFCDDYDALWTTQYEYNLADQLIRIVYPDQSVVTYQYDDRGRLIKVGTDQDDDYYAAFEYNARDQVTALYLGNYESGGLQQVDYTYNDRGWLTSVNDLTADSGAVADRFRQWLYYEQYADSAQWGGYYNGDVLAQRTEHNGGNSLLRHYTYDELDRLTGYSSTVGSEQYFYDGNGNRDSVDYGSITYTYNYGTGNRLDSINIPGLQQALQMFEYDEVGNAKRAWYWTKDLAMSYDDYSQMRNVYDMATNGDQMTSGYSPEGLRVWKWYYREEDTCTILGGVELESVVLNGQLPVDCTVWLSDWTFYVRGKNGNVLAEYDELDSETTPVNKYIYAGDQRIAMRDADGNLFFYINDHLGSAGVLIDSAGTVRDKYRYKPFGGTENGQSVNVGQAYRFTGKPLDEELSMNWYYYGKRYYAPAEGRFLSVDPSEIKYPTWGPYVYALDNPLILVDPFGADVAHVKRVVAAVNTQTNEAWNLGMSTRSDAGLPFEAGFHIVFGAGGGIRATETEVYAPGRFLSTYEPNNEDSWGGFSHAHTTDVDKKDPNTYAQCFSADDFYTFSKNVSEVGQVMIVEADDARWVVEVNNVEQVKANMDQVRAVFNEVYSRQHDVLHVTPRNATEQASIAVVNREGSGLTLYRSTNKQKTDFKKIAGEDEK